MPCLAARPRFERGLNGPEPFGLPLADRASSMGIVASEVENFLVVARLVFELFKVSKIASRHHRFVLNDQYGRERIPTRYCTLGSKA